jgi:hypothetical protein
MAMFFLQGPLSQAISGATQASAATALSHLQINQIISAIGGLGTAAFGLVDAAKTINFDRISINRIGFADIKNTVESLTPPPAGGVPTPNALPRANIVETIQANWMNGTDLASQKAIAKSLIKLHLSDGNADAVAKAANVDATLLKLAAQKMAAGAPLLQPESDVYARFDLILTAMLDETYQHSDQFYRNWTRAIAAIFAVVLALAGGWTLDNYAPTFWRSGQAVLAFLIGLLATPLAPVAKDLSTALATAVNTLQLVKK